MNMKELTGEICISGTLQTEFEIRVDHVSDEFHSINLNSNNKKEKSYTLLILPQLPLDRKDIVLGKFSKLFGDNSKGGEE